MRTSPPPGKKRVADWVGLRVKTRREMQNGYVTIAAGTVGEVGAAGGGLGIDFEKCKHCGVGARITRAHPTDVEVLP